MAGKEQDPAGKEQDQNDELIGHIIRIGIEIYRAGGEVTRAEDTVRRILRAYGFRNVEVYTITSLLEVSVTDAAGNNHTQAKRIGGSGTDLEKLCRLNALSRQICRQPPMEKQLSKLLEDAIRPVKERPYISYIGAILAAGGFTVFFGGTMYDTLATAVLACVITWLDRKGIYKKANQLLFYIICSIITGILGVILVHFGLGVHLDKILIGCIMLTIPGIAITYAVRDMLIGELITGLLRFVESLLIAASIAGGFILSFMIAGSI